MEIQRIRLKKLHNTRDLGGIPTTDGKQIRSGKLIRSGRLSSLPEQTKKTLSEIGVTTVVDFRVAPEIKKHPDSLPEGVVYRNLPFFTSPDEVFVPEKTMGKTSKRESHRLGREFTNFDAYMIACYKKILWSAESQQMLREFLQIVAKEEGCLLFHCTGGKDRTGIASMLIESLLGVSEENILIDYLASRKFLRGLYARYRFGIAIAPAFTKTKRMVLGFLRLKESYLRAAIDSIREANGTVEAYCREVLGITGEEISIMRKKYLI